MCTLWTHLGIPQPLVGVSMQVGWALVSAVSGNVRGHASIRMSAGGWPCLRGELCFSSCRELAQDGGTGRTSAGSLAV